MLPVENIIMYILRVQQHTPPPSFRILLKPSSPCLVFVGVYEECSWRFCWKFLLLFGWMFLLLSPLSWSSAYIITNIVALFFIHHAPPPSPLAWGFCVLSLWDVSCGVSVLFMPFCGRSRARRAKPKSGAVTVYTTEVLVVG